MISNQFTDHKIQLQDFVDDTVNLVMDRLNRRTKTADDQKEAVLSVQESLVGLLTPLSERYGFDADAIAKEFAETRFARIMAACEVDARRYQTEDPGLENIEEVFYASNGYWATVAYRIANTLLQLEVPIVPRAISSIAHSRTGVDIHPGATIEPGLFIDHGTGIAIGCTAVIHANVNLYNGVVLGTRSKPKKKTIADTSEIQKRHPTIESGVSLYTNAFVGGDIVIGAGSTIGAYAFVCHDVAEESLVTGRDSGNPVSSEQLAMSNHTQNPTFPLPEDQSVVTNYHCEYMI